MSEPYWIPLSVQAKPDPAVRSLGYVELTTSLAVSAGTEVAPTTVLSLPSITFDGVSPVLIEFSCPYHTVPAAIISYGLNLWDMTANADLGRIFQQQIVDSSGRPGVTLGQMPAKRRFLPAAGARVYAVRGWRSANTVTWVGGTGGAGAPLPAYLLARYDN